MTKVGDEKKTWWGYVDQRRDGDFEAK